MWPMHMAPLAVRRMPDAACRMPYLVCRLLLDKKSMPYAVCMAVWRDKRIERDRDRVRAPASRAMPYAMDIHNTSTLFIVMCLTDFQILELGRSIFFRPPPNAL